MPVDVASVGLLGLESERGNDNRNKRTRISHDVERETGDADEVMELVLRARNVVCFGSSTQMAPSALPVLLQVTVEESVCDIP